MKGMGDHIDDPCPITLNFEPDTFKPGDLVSYRVPEEFGDTPFVGEILEVKEDHILICHYDADEKADKSKSKVMRATKVVRPVVSATEALE